MRQTVATIITLMVMVSSAQSFQYWNGIRNSALLPGGDVNIRVENPAGAGIENYLLYAEGGVQEQVMTGITDGPSTLSATVPGPGAIPEYYGFRLIQGGEIDLMPVRVATGANPAPEDLTRVAEDVLGDELFGFTNLDLTDCRISFSDDRLYASLQNAGGGFPVNQGLTFFGYLLGIANPAVAEPDTVWGLLYTIDQAGIVSPGLYRIEGTGFDDLNKLGEIDVQSYPAANSIVISCLLSDLLADPLFAAWYDPSEPILDIAGFTQRITLLGGPMEADRTPGALCHLREYAIAPGTNQLPALANGGIQAVGSEAFAQIEYSDADGNSPVMSEIVFDGTVSVPLFPLTLDYSETVVYRTDTGVDPIADGSWSTAIFRFSDNQTDVVEFNITPTGIDDMDVRIDSNRLKISNAPNPFVDATTLEVYLPRGGHARVSVHNVTGALVAIVAEGYMTAGYHYFDWRSAVSSQNVHSGVFFARVSTSASVQARKMVLIR